MIDVNTLWFVMGAPAVVGFLLETRYRDLVRPLALLLSIPTIIWLYGLASMVIAMPENTDIDLPKLMLTIFNNNFELLILSYAGGAIGTTAANRLFRNR